MKNDEDDFQKADREAGAENTSKVEVVDAQVVYAPSSEVAPRSDILAFRQKLIEQYHGGNASLTERLKKQGKDDMDSLLLALIDEITKETDHLLGNELVAAENGELRDATVISFKRSEVLEKVMRAIQAKQQFEKERGLDLDSPALMIVIRYFIAKSKEALAEMQQPTEVQDLFLRTLGKNMDHWKEELKKKLDEPTRV